MKSSSSSLIELSPALQTTEVLSLDLGFKNSVIKFDKKQNVWKAEVSGMSLDTTATSESSYATYGLGAYLWNIENDNIDCSSKGEPYGIKLKLSGCKEGEFTCSDGQCIR